MGFMDSIQQQAGNAGHEGLVSGLLSMFGGSSAGGGKLAGLLPLVEAFRQRGLGGAVESWISTGQNLPISPEQVEQVLGNEKIQQLCNQFHVSPDMVKSMIAQHLPNAVDQMTPNGQLPQR